MAACPVNPRLSMRPYSAVIFDMDGVIVDSEPRHEQTFRDIFHELGYGDRHGIHFHDYIGRSDRALWDDFIAMHRPPQSLEELTELKQGRFLDNIRAAQPIFAGIPELVAKLASGTKLAVASGSLHIVIETVLAMRDLKRHFPVVVSVQDVGRPKPAPDIFLRAAEQLGVPPQECVVIEDSAAGVAAARAAGMRVIAITNTLPADRLRDADAVVDTYAEIERLLL